MENKTYNSIIPYILSKGVLTILGCIALASCGIQMDGYTETDGIYYNPSTDKIEQKIAWQDTEERGYYNYEGSIIGQSQKNQKQQDQKYNSKNWGNNQTISTSDWGTYTGTKNNYFYDNYPSWIGYPYYYNSFYSPYYFGYYNSYFGNYYNYWGINFSWGTPWGYSYYTPYYWGYNGYYRNYYRYNPWYYDSFYPPYYGHYTYHHYNRGYYSTPVRHYRRSGNDDVYRGNVNSNNRGFNNNSWGNNPQPNRSQNNSFDNNGFNRTSNWGNRTPNHQNNSNHFPNRTPNTSSNSNWGRSSNWGQNNSGSFHSR